VDEVALGGLGTFDVDGERHVLESDPSLTAVVEKFVAQGLDLLDVAAVYQDSGEGPAYF
jgi:diketogulonate reductase-like aldo/keto reductase